MEFVSFFVLAVFAGYLVNHFNLGVIFQGIGSGAQNFWLLLPDYAVLVMIRFFLFSFFLCLILIAGIIWTSHKIMQTREKMDEIFPKAEPAEGKVKAEIPPAIVNQKWLNIVKNINSESPSDWKLAILECDIILGDILEKMGYLQPSISEKLKAIEPSDFTSIESAWEAHKIRNAIAHEGSDFVINQREAKRVVGLYEVVFREFAYI